MRGGFEGVKQTMNHDKQTRVLTRREILAAGALALAGLTMAPGRLLADAAAVDKLMKEHIGDRVPEQGRVTLEVPQIAENGNTVPITVEVESPMSADDYVKRKLATLGSGLPSA